MKRTSRIFTCLGEIESEMVFFGFINNHATAANAFIVAAKTKNEFAVPVSWAKNGSVIFATK